MMNDRPEPQQPDWPVGLCATCRFLRIVRSAKGGQFVLCGRSAVDPAFVKYPRLPVWSCSGYEESAPGGADPLG